MKSSACTRRVAGLTVVAAALSLFASPALAQSKFIKEANSGSYIVGGFEGDTVLLSALNICDVPIHVTMRIVDGATGDPIGTTWDADIAAGRAARLDVVLGALSGGTAHRIWGDVEVSTTAADANPACMRGKNSPVSSQLEIVSSGGGRLLLPAVQKIRSPR